jgi:hypothetical protein
VSVCPVCGKGRTETDKFDPYDYMPPQTRTVSHLSCVEKLKQFCETTCEPWIIVNEKDVALKQAEREAAFWKWLWEREVDKYLPTHTGWLDHMRERFEEEER